MNTNIDKHKESKITSYTKHCKIPANKSTVEKLQNQIISACSVYV